MPFTRVNPGDLIQAQNLNQVIGSLNGTSGQGVPIAQVAVNDATNYALSVQNLEVTNSRAVNIVKSDGSLLIRADATGVSLGTPLNLPANSVNTTAIANNAVTNAKLGTDTARLNQLTNGGFEVWQRGNGPFTGTTVYTADRWYISGTVLSVSRDTTNVDGSPTALAMTFSTAGTNNQLFQKLEGSNLNGKTLSFSIRVRCSQANSIRALLADSAGTAYSAFHSGDGTYQTLTVTRTLAAASTINYIGVDIAAVGTAYLDNAMLVVGSVPADYAPLHPADDLARCLRYYDRWSIPANGNYPFVGSNNSSTVAVISGATHLPMAVTPTFTSAPPANINVVVASWATAFVSTAISAAGTTPTSFLVNVTIGSASLTAAAPAFLQAATSSSWIAMEANP